MPDLERWNRNNLEDSALHLRQPAGGGEGRRGFPNLVAAGGVAGLASLVLQDSRAAVRTTVGRLLSGVAHLVGIGQRLVAWVHRTVTFEKKFNQSTPAIPIPLRIY